MKVEFKDVVKYKFKEDKILDDIKKYVSKTYSSHYAQTNKYQATRRGLPLRVVPSYRRDGSYFDLSLAAHRDTIYGGKFYERKNTHRNDAGRCRCTPG